MDLEELTKVAEKEKLTIVNCKTKNKARILNKYILMDYSRIESNAEEKKLLAEEIRSLLL